MNPAEWVVVVCWSTGGIMILAAIIGGWRGW